MSKSNQPIRDALPPFSGELPPLDEVDEPPPDTILRSRDLVDFHVHKAILGHVSVAFFGMVNFEGEPEIIKDGKPVVPLTESSSTLHRLLCYAYPVESPPSITSEADLDGVCDVHEAAHKYQMFKAQRLIETMLMEQPLVNAYPHRLFIIAAVRNIPHLASKAAHATLKLPVCPPISVLSDMHRITADRLQRLYNFHHACGTAAQELLKNLASVPDEAMGYDGWHTSLSETSKLFVWWKDEGHSGECGPFPSPETLNSSIPESFPAPWFRSHMLRIARELKSLPAPETVGHRLVQLDAVPTCILCQRRASEDLADYAGLLSEALETSNEKVLSLHFNL